jgi:oligopeptide/dipeptide ABC transporter ATP-binding protein
LHSGDFDLKEEKPVVDVRNLKVNFHTYRGEVKALNGVDLKLFEQEVLGLVGESGCGKSVTALTILDLLSENAYVLGGEILLRGEDLLRMSKEERRVLRVNELATVFQDPMTFLNPVLKVETQLSEVFTLNKKLLERAVLWEKSEGIQIAFLDLLSKGKKFNVDSSGLNISRKEIKKMTKNLCIDILRLVQMPDPERILTQYPFELSGGMRQRIMIAMALARRPSVLIADEITTAVDVTIQAQILHLLRELRDKIDTSILLITHDLSVAAEAANRIAVMYGGNVVEVAPTKEIFKDPVHPYTLMLMRSIPNVKKPVERLNSIPGTVPEMINPPSGCRFHPRCSVAKEDCDLSLPKLREVSKNHYVACH